MKLGCAVANVGDRDLTLGYEEFEKRTRGLPLRFVSTNIVRQDTREPVFEPYAILEAPRGGDGPPLKVGVFGVVRFSPVWLKQGPEGSSLVIAQPLEMLRRYLDEVRAKSDLVVVLAAASNMDAHRIAKEVPGLDFVFGAYGGAVNTVEESEGTTRVFYTGNQGKNLGETRVYLATGASGREVRSDTYFHVLTAKYPDDPELRAFVEDALAKAKAATGTATPVATEKSEAPSGGGQPPAHPRL